MTVSWTLRRIRRQFSRQRRMAWASAAAFVLLVWVVAASLLAVRAARGWMSTVGQSVSVLVFLHPEATDEHADQLATVLRRTSGVAQVHLVEPAETLARLRDSEARSGSSGWMDDLEPGYFPRSLEVALVPASDLAQRAAQLAQRLRSLPGVVQVDAMTEGLARLGAWIRFGQRLGWAVALAATVMASGLLLGTVVWGRRRRAHNAQVLLLLGETKRGARVPSHVLLALSGLLGAAVALVALRLGWPALLAWVESWLGLPSGAPVLLRPIEAALCLILAPALGWLLGYLSSPASDPVHA